MVKLDSQQVKVRQFITQSFVQTGHPPHANEIAEKLALQPEKVKQVLKSLAENKALVLHPSSAEVWIAHPFSASPNSFWVQDLEEEMGWWSNCTWCAMGIAALVSKPVRLVSRWGGESETFTLEIRNGEIQHRDFIVHFATPVPRLWENVMHSCSMMLPHKSEKALDDWCKRHQFEKGASLSADKCWQLSKKWYGGYLDHDWNRKSPEEVMSFFRSIGLDLNFQSI